MIWWSFWRFGSVQDKPAQSAISAELAELGPSSKTLSWAELSLTWSQKSWAELSWKASSESSASSAHQIYNSALELFSDLMMSSSRKFLLQKRFNFVDSESRNSFRLRNATSSRICESSRSSCGSSRSRARKIRRSSKNWFGFVERNRLRKRGRTTSDRNCFGSAETSGRMLDYWQSRKSFENLWTSIQVKNKIKLA